MRTRLASAVLLALLTAAVATGVALAQWPTTCVELNDIAEAHLDNHGNVGIYQRVFGDQAEQACQQDHLVDVQTTFAWAIPTAAPAQGSVNAQWPTTCVELNDVVEAHLGNHGNVGIYQRAFGAQAEVGCRTDHLADVQSIFWWAIPGAQAPVRIEPSNWTWSEGTHGHGGTFTYAYVSSNYFYSDDRNAGGPARLRVRCTNHGESADVFVGFGSNIYLAGLRDVLRAVHQFDDHPQQTLWWDESTNNTSAFVPNRNEVDFALAAVAASRLSLTITSYDGERTTARWSLQGHNDPNHPVRRVLADCGLI